MADNDIAATKVWANREDMTSSALNAEFSNIRTKALDKSQEQEASGRITFSGGLIVDELLTIAAAGAGLVNVVDIRYDPASGTVADNDGMYLSWMYDDDAGNETEYMRYGMRALDVSNGTEQAEFFLQVAENSDGALDEVLTVGESYLDLTSNQALTELRIDNTATDGDAALAWQLSGTSKFTMGVDDGDSDKLKIGTTAVGTGTWFEATGALLTLSSKLTVGVDDTGYDVQFFGATSGSYALWDESADSLLLTDSTPLKIGDSQDLTLYHDGSNSYITNAVGALKIATETSGIAVTIGHGTSEVTIADNLTVTGTLTLGSGAELTEAELEFLDGITAGTAAASKAMVLDSSADITGGRNITISGELDAATLDVSGDADIDGTLEADAITVNGTALSEYIADTTGAMFGSNTETGITVTYQDGDNTIDLALDAAQTVITSLLATDIKIGEDDQTKIDFETADEIHFYAANVEQVYLADNIFGPQSDSDVDLGTTGVRWKDAFVDSITVTGEVDGASLDISGNADIDGTTNLDAVDIDGAVQVDNTITVGVDDAGYDVKFFGNAADAYMLWDASTDDLILGGAAKLGIGTTSPDASLHIVGGTATSLRVGDNQTDGTEKSGALTLNHITNAEQPLMLIMGDSASGVSTVLIGGGFAGTNAATLIDFFVAADNTTTTGTRVARFSPGILDLMTTGNRIDLDTDNDTSIRCSSDDLISFELGGNDASVTMTSAGSGAPAVTINALVTNGDAALDLTQPASSTAILNLRFKEGSGNGDANNMQYAIRYLPGSDYLSLQSQDTDGGSTSADIWRVLDGQTTIDANTTWDENVFDYVCDGCGRHEEAMFACCGKVAWHDDTALMVDLVHAPSRLTAVQQLHKLGIVSEYTEKSNGSIEAFQSIQKSTQFTWSAMAQLYQKIDSLEAEVAQLRKV